MSLRNVVRIYRRLNPSLAPSVLVEKTGVDHSLLFQNGAVVTLDAKSTDVERQQYTKIIDAYGLLGILRISSEESVLIAITGVLSIGQLYGGEISKITGCEFVQLRSSGASDSVDPRLAEFMTILKKGQCAQLEALMWNNLRRRLAKLQRLISSGMFYYSSNTACDFTSSTQRRADGKGCDNRFFWNRTLHFPFERYNIDTAPWLLKCIAGSVLIRTVYVGSLTGKVALISRLSCERVGTRFNVRGVSHQGSVANFVETEQAIVFDESECSFTQIRGSIPLFWDQPGIQVGSHKVKLRAFEASGPAYHRHFSNLKHHYNSVVIVNLLGVKEGEKMLGDAFKTQHKNSKFADFEFVSFDYHSMMKASKESINQLKKKLDPACRHFSFYAATNGTILRKQGGVLRVNCLDCLDRTNSVQTAMGIQMVADQIASLNINAGKVNVVQRVEEILKDLWQKNGDQCSTIYAGTGALDGKSKLKDASRSIARTIQNNLMDSTKQESFDLLLTGSSFESRLFDKACNIFPAGVVQEYANAVEQMVERSDEVTEACPLKVFVGTWNVNGGKNIHNVAFRGESNLSHWIFQQSTNLVNVSDISDVPDIVAIGVEELVDLNASNMMKASTTNQRLWLDSIRQTLNQRAKYIHVASEQLVGVCLFLFVRRRVTPFLKDIAVSSVKTGLGGATGNKGSVAFRVVIHSTTLCFVCSHFAAGQNEVKDRNEDYQSALRKVRFPQNRDIDSNDVIFWLGDFNYRINLTGDEVKRAVFNRQLEQLVPNDQLTQQKMQGLTFVDFEEGPLRFAPTYKYDTFSDDYDTSEKCRAPAWTDRVLWKENRKAKSTKLIWYDRAELKTSDHRPVGALFSVDLRKVKHEGISTLVEDVIACTGPPDGTIICSMEGRGKFVSNCYMEVANKLKDLGVNQLMSKYDNEELWIVLDSGESALAALSMDGLKLDSGEVLSVRLRSPEWMYAVKPHVSAYDTEDDALWEEEDAVADLAADDVVAFEMQGDDDDEMWNATSMLAPDRSRPSSARSEKIRDSPDAAGNLFSASMPSRASAASLLMDSGYRREQAVPLRSAPPPPPQQPSVQRYSVPVAPSSQQPSAAPAYGPLYTTNSVSPPAPPTAIPPVRPARPAGMPVIPPRPKGY